MPPPTAASNRNVPPCSRADRLQRRAVVRDHVLVGGDNALARPQRRRDQRPGRLVAAHQLHDDVHLGVRHEVRRRVRDDRGRDAARDHAIHELVGDARERQPDAVERRQLVRSLEEGADDGPADGARAEHRDAKGGRPGHPHDRSGRVGPPPRPGCGAPGAPGAGTVPPPRPGREAGRRWARRARGCRTAGVAQRTDRAHGRRAAPVPEQGRFVAPATQYIGLEPIVAGGEPWTGHLFAPADVVGGSGVKPGLNGRPWRRVARPGRRGARASRGRRGARRPTPARTWRGRVRRSGTLAGNVRTCLPPRPRHVVPRRRRCRHAPPGSAASAASSRRARPTSATTWAPSATTWRSSIGTSRSTASWTSTPSRAPMTRTCSAAGRARWRRRSWRSASTRRPAPSSSRATGPR